jgi:hypothetical protein
MKKKRRKGYSMNMLTLIYIPGHSILTADRIDIYELKE